MKFTDYEELNKKLKKLNIDIVIHCATHYIKNHTYKDIKKLINSNILLGNIILENLSNMKVKKFINFSTVWQDPHPKKNNFQNLYAAYKSGFNRIVNFYRKILSNVEFFEIVLSDTFGFDDKRTTKPGQYVFKNSNDLKIYDLIKIFNKSNGNKIKVKWLSTKVIKNKIIKYDQLKPWAPKKSGVKDIINYIKNK